MPTTGQVAGFFSSVEGKERCTEGETRDHGGQAESIMSEV